MGVSILRCLVMFGRVCVHVWRQVIVYTYSALHLLNFCMHVALLKESFSPACFHALVVAIVSRHFLQWRLLLCSPSPLPARPCIHFRCKEARSSRRVVVLFCGSPVLEPSSHRAAVVFCHSPVLGALGIRPDSRRGASQTRGLSRRAPDPGTSPTCQTRRWFLQQFDRCMVYVESRIVMGFLVLKSKTNYNFIYRDIEIE